jgi:hypothetical protein
MLAGCDKVPVLGAAFERKPGASPVVKSVEPHSFAEAMGMKLGDVAVRFALARREVSVDDFLARFESQLPNSSIELIVRRKVEPAPGQDPRAPAQMKEVRLYSTKRNSPAVSLFVGEDREWVLWMPSSFYDTSIVGDAKYLGWHLNQSTILEARPTDFLEFIKFDAQFRRPELLNNLLLSADPARALASREWAVPRIGADPHRLKVLAIGIDTITKGAIPPIRFADRDARDLAAFLAVKGSRLGFDQVVARALVGPDATAVRVRDAIADLGIEPSGRHPYPGDAVVVFLETRLRSDERGLELCTSDSNLGPPPGPIVSTAEVGDHLKRLALQGYQVLVFLDLRHQSDPEGLDRPLAEWVRSLFREGVVVLVSSQNGPGLRLESYGHGAFAEGLITTLINEDHVNPEQSSSTRLTIGSLFASVERAVSDLTGRRQQPRGYFGNLPARTPVLDPVALERRVLAMPKGKD